MAAGTGGGQRQCPICGSRVGASATKCLVCGANLTSAAAPTAGSLGRRPLSLAQAGLIALLVVIAIAGVGLIVQATGLIDIPGTVAALGQDPPTATTTPTSTPPPSATPQPTSTDTPEPTPTPLPPVEYVVQTGDTCLGIAFSNQVSVGSIVEANRSNGLITDPNCQFLPPPGTTILVPVPTPTPSALPTATLGAGIGPTAVARPTWQVLSGQNLQAIATRFGLTVQDLMDANAIRDPNAIQAGQILIIPVELAVTPGPTPTPTPLPPYTAPSLLVPADGQPFGPGETVTLQWVSVGELRPGELYQVVLEDVTCQCARTLTEYVVDMRFVIPERFQPESERPHIYRWSITPVRLRPGSDANAPAYDPAGPTSQTRTFVWQRGAGPAATPQP